MKAAAALAALGAVTACDPFNTTFDDIEDARLYQAARIVTPPATAASLKVMTYNIKFGGGRIDFFWDCHGERVIMTRKEVDRNLAALAVEIKRVNPDIVLLQEVDVESKRSQYVDQVQALLDLLPGLNYGAYASQWKADYVPSDGLGRVDSGSAVLSRWPIVAGRRIALPLIGSQSGIKQYFYLRRAILDTRVQVPGMGKVAVLNVHTAAYAQDDTKKRHVELFKEELDRVAADKTFFVAGGDLNTLPPDATKMSGFPDSVCEDEEFNVERDKAELTFMLPYYKEYAPATTRAAYVQDEKAHFTHSVSQYVLWNRKLDYLFTNGKVKEAGQTHQQTMGLSDHCPVSAVFAK